MFSELFYAVMYAGLQLTIIIYSIDKLFGYNMSESSEKESLLMSSDQQSRAEE